MAALHPGVPSVNLYLYVGCSDVWNNNNFNGNGNVKVDAILISRKKWGGGRGKEARVLPAIGSCNRLKWRLNASTEVRIAENYSRSSNSSNAQIPINPSVEIPVTCYQILGVSDQAEKDEVVKSVMHLKTAEIEEGYTMDAVISRQNLLMDVRDKLLFEPEYAGDIKEKVPPKSALRIPWAWLPGAICLLQEVGEEQLVLDIGRRALQHPDSKPYVHDLLLSMALAECAIAKAGFEKNKISQGFEALARAQCLLRSKVSLGKMTLLSQIEESLEELAPACTLELLGMPHTPENAERRLGAISALRELVRQGLDVETSCRVQDWPCFLSQALKKLMASEIVELLPWDSLALIRKNKKSLESQNQRVVIDFNCFYMVLIAYIAFGFSSKQANMIEKAENICECLIASEGVDLKCEQAVCLFLLGQGDETTAAEKVRELEVNTNPASPNSVPEKESRDGSSAKTSLETWLKDAVLGLFPDTRDCSPSLVNFFAGEKRSPVHRQNKRIPQSTMNHRQLAHALPLDRGRIEESGAYTDTSRHLGPAVKQLAPPNLQGPLVADESRIGADVGMPSVQLKRNLGTNQSRVWEIWLGLNSMATRMIFATFLGVVLFASFRFQFRRVGNASKWRFNEPSMAISSSWSTDSSLERGFGAASIGRSTITRKLIKLLSKFKLQILQHPKTADARSASLATGLSSVTAACRKPMPVEEAETLVKQWQAVKADALGPRHDVDRLFDVLDESMLVQWQALADAAKSRSCFWRFVLLQLSILRADTVTDGTGNEIAEIEAFLEEAAELVDESQPKNPNYYSMYKIHYVLKRQDDGSWRFCEGDIQKPA